MLLLSNHSVTAPLSLCCRGVMRMVRVTATTSVAKAINTHPTNLASHENQTIHGLIHHQSLHAGRALQRRPCLYRRRASCGADLIHSHRSHAFRFRLSARGEWRCRRWLHRRDGQCLQRTGHHLDRCRCHRSAARLSQWHGRSLAGEWHLWQSPGGLRGGRFDRESQHASRLGKHGGIRHRPQHPLRECRRSGHRNGWRADRRLRHRS